MQARELDTGDVVAGTYQLIRPLGRGGMGAVYEAEHLRTKKRVAAKTLKPGVSAVREVVARFQREARTTGLLEHPGIVKVDDFLADDDGTLVLVMELLPGPSLRELVDDEGALAPARAFGLAGQLLDALGYAHALGVIHRDLKPGNVKLVDDGAGGERAKIYDFGIARLVGDAEARAGDGEKLTEAGMAFGTPDYMSPEQALGQPADGRADLYALGVMLYEMLTGRKPFEADEAIAVARMQVAAPPPTLAEKAPGRRWSAAAEALIARALGKRPDERFADAAAMKAAVDAAAVAEAGGADDSSAALPARPAAAQKERPWTTPGLAAPTTPPRAPWRPTRKQKLAAAASLGLLAFVILALAFPGRPPEGGVSGGTLGKLGTTRHELPVPSELARKALALIDGGKPAEAATLLEAELAGPAGDKDATAHLALGHARAALGRKVQALAAYERAVTLAPALADDPRLLASARAFVDGRDEALALGALELVARGQDAGPELLVDVAARGKKWAVRQRAIALAEKLGVAERIDALARHSADLAQAPSCAERKAAVAALRKLGDPKAIPALERARRRTSGFFGNGRPNACLAADAAAAVEELKAKEK